MFDDKFLKKVLVDQSYVSNDDYNSALEHNSSVIEYLMSNNIISQDTLGLAISEHFDTTFTDLDDRLISTDTIKIIPADKAKKLRVVFVEDKNGIIVIATDKMEDSKSVLSELKKIFPKKKINLTYSFSESIDNALSFYEATLDTRFSKIIKKEKGVTAELFNEIISEGLLYRASDVHFEPREDRVDIRFRVDGLLKLAGSLTKEIYENVLNRIKIESNLRIDEHNASQDGAIRFKYNKKNIDLRVSIVPVVDGEKVVIRIIAGYVKNTKFSDLGFSEKHIDLFEKIQKKPFGMIIVTGPTGSGKTTTLYSFVRNINNPDKNITTIEDPVEYYIPGTNQISVNEKKGVTFAKGLRSIVRQDPDIIMLGEIRDHETAETAINASLTGHMLLSTFHANDASTTIPRMLDMGVEPFLLSSTLDLIVSQRLVRKICESCRHSYVAKVTELEKENPGVKKFFGRSKSVTLYKGEGCGSCNNTGYNGRTALAEIIEVDKDLKNLIQENPSSGQIQDIAKKNGHLTMFEDGVRKAKLGMTSLEEVLRVTEI